jgi:hypothetical protein
MPKRVTLEPEKLAQIATLAQKGVTPYAISRETGVSQGRVERALARKIVDRTRKAGDFLSQLAIMPQRQVGTSTSWSLEKIRSARDAQIAGNFSQAVQLARMMRTDAALFTAYCARIAPQSSVASKLVGSGSTRGELVAKKAADSVQVPSATLKSIHGTLANHAIAIGYNDHEFNAEGTRVNFRMREWPLEHVRWNPSLEVLQTTARDSGKLVNIEHGNGRWTVFQKTDNLPWTQEAAILPGGLLWAMHAEAGADWAGASRSHGRPKVIGELPAGFAAQVTDENGATRPTPEVLAFLDMLVDIAAGDTPAGIRPAGSKTDLLFNGSTAWQVFSELRNDSGKGAARIYLGTDAILGSVGGAPGVDIATLFGVASTILQGDFAAIERGLNTGVYVPWTAMNEGDSRYAPRWEYQLPDPDSAGKSEETNSKLSRLFEQIDNYKKQGMQVDQTTITKLARSLGIESADVPQLAQTGRATVTVQLAPTDIAKVVRVSEARLAQGLQPFGDARDNMTITELDAASTAKAETPPVAAPIA